MGRRVTLILAVALILTGVLSLLRTLGVITISVGGLIGALVLIAIGGAVLWGVLSGPDGHAIEEVGATIPLEGSTEASVRVGHGAGRLVVDGSAAPGDLVSGVFAGGLDADTSLEGGILKVVMRPARAFWPGVASPWRWSRGQSLDWRFGLSPEVPLSLRFETGASDSRIDLGELRVTDVWLSTGASSTVISLPKNAGHTSVRIDGGAASVKIRVPEGVAARIRVSGGLSSTSISRARFPRVDGAYQSPDYDVADNRADIVVDMGVGSVSVR